METARRRLNTSEERMKTDFDLKTATRPFDEGELVYMLDTATVKGKLSPSWKGPGIILKNHSLVASEVSGDVCERGRFTALRI